MKFLIQFGISGKMNFSSIHEENFTNITRKILELWANEGNCNIDKIKPMISENF